MIIEMHIFWKIETPWVYVSSLCTFWNMCCLDFSAMNWMMFGDLDDVVYMFKIVKLLLMYEPYVCVKGFVCQ